MKFNVEAVGSSSQGFFKKDKITKGAGKCLLILKYKDVSREI